MGCREARRHEVAHIRIVFDDKHQRPRDAYQGASGVTPGMGLQFDQRLRRQIRLALFQAPLHLFALWRPQRQLHFEQGSAKTAVIRANRSAMQFDEFTYNRQTEPGAPGLARPAAQLMKGFEHSLS